MSLRYTIPESGDLVRVVGTGLITTRQCMKVLDRIMSDPRHRAESAAVVDLRKAVYKPGNLSEVLDIAKTMHAVRAMLKGRIAIVAERTTILPAEIVSSHLRKVAGIGIRVFADVAAAKAFCRGTRFVPKDA